MVIEFNGLFRPNITSVGHELQHLSPASHDHPNQLQSFFMKVCPTPYIVSFVHRIILASQYRLTPSLMAMNINKIGKEMHLVQAQYTTCRSTPLRPAKRTYADSQFTLQVRLIRT